MTGTVIPFPPQLRAVQAPVDALSPEGTPPVLVEHNGRVYRLANLLAGVHPLKLTRIEAAAPRSGQEAWDMAVRSWLALTWEFVAGLKYSTSSPPR